MLMCENADGCLICFYVRRAYFFFAPIILDMFQDIADRWLPEEWLFRVEALLRNWVYSKKKIELRRGNIDFRYADSLGFFDIFLQMKFLGNDSL